MAGVRFSKIRGIRGQIILSIVLATLSAIGLMGALALSIVSNSVILGKVGEAEKIERIIESGLRAAPRDINAYAKIFMKSEALMALRIKDAEGGVAFSEGVLPSESGELLSMDETMRIYRTYGKDDRAYIYVSSKGQGQAFASTVEFTLSLSEVTSYISYMRNILIFYAIGSSIVIIALGVYFLSVFIIKPVKRLEGVAVRIAHGEFGIRADSGGDGDNEISSLARAFNIMADKLEGEIKGLENLNSELISARVELLKTASLAAVGRLAAGIAHEIGNPLGAISGYLGILAKGASDKSAFGAEESDIIKRLEREITRINNIVKEFLSIGRESSNPQRDITAVNVNDVIRETIEFLKPHNGFERVNVQLSLKENIPPVIMDGDKLRQVFMNILINAAESVKGQGSITVESTTDERPADIDTMGRRRRDDDDIGEPARRVGRDEKRSLREYAIVSFRDTGGGITKEDMERLFEPFYTTKTASTGLGLFVSRSIIKIYGGEIEVDSISGKGSVFRVILPTG